MTDTTAPWSVPVRLDEVGPAWVRRLEADEPTRARIAEALELEGLKQLSAEVEVKPRFDGGRLRGRLWATAVRTCGITLEPFDEVVEGEFEVQLSTREPEPPPPGEELGLADLDTPDYLPDGVVDLGQYVVEHLALELSPFPRKPGAVFEQPDQAPEPSPFAALSALKINKSEA